MKKAFPVLLVITSAILLIGKQNVFLGSGLGLAQFPLILIFSWLLWKRRKKGYARLYKVMAVLLGLLLLYGLYERVQRIHFVSLPDKPQRVSVLSYNLFFKNGYPDNILNEIEQTNPDVLLVQEFTSRWDSRLSQQVGGRYPYKRKFVNNRTNGLALFSRYPIKSVHYLKNTRGLPRSQICVLEVAGREVVFVNTHIASPAVAVENPEAFVPLYLKNAKDRKAQWEDLELYLDETYPDLPQIVAGDLNTMRIEPLYRSIRQDWQDVFAKKGWGMGYTFPNVASFPFPLITLDYILCRGEVKPISAKVLPGSSSDHLSIWGEVEV